MGFCIHTESKLEIVKVFLCFVTIARGGITGLDVLAGVLDDWSHDDCSQEAERKCAACFSLLSLEPRSSDGITHIKRHVCYTLLYPLKLIVKIKPYNY